MGSLDSFEILEANRRSYQDQYATGHGFLRYPSDWVIRFHSLYLKRHVPGGRVLDYRCGSGHNSVFFLDKGYEVWGHRRGGGGRADARAYHNSLARRLLGWEPQVRFMDGCAPHSTGTTKPRTPQR